MKEKEIRIKYSELSLEELDLKYKTIIKSAISTAKNAYSEYSNFKVGASVLLSNGEIINGNNQENAAYPSGLCAERVAIFWANANLPDSYIQAIVILGISNDNKLSSKIISPCGACRQVLIESEQRFKQAIKVILASSEKVLIFESAKDLLPLSFNKDDLIRL